MPIYTTLTTHLKENPQDIINTILESTSMATSDAISSSMLNFLAFHNLSVPYLKMHILEEINKNDTESTLFPSSAIVTLLTSAFLELVSVPYLKAVLFPQIAKFASSKKNFELDENKLGPKGVSQLAKNEANLKEATKQLVEVIYKSNALLPPPVIDILNFIYTNVQKKFSTDAANRIIGGAFITRLICPVIVNAQVSQNSPQTSRNMVLLAKTVQNIASNNNFRKRREKFLLCLNEFIQPLFPTMNEFLAKLGKSMPGDYDHSETIKVKKAVIRSSIRELHSYLTENSERILDELQENDEDDEEIDSTPDSNQEDTGTISTTSSSVGDASQPNSPDVAITPQSIHKQLYIAVNGVILEGDDPEYEGEDAFDDDDFIIVKKHTKDREDDPRVVLNAAEDPSVEAVENPVFLARDILINVVNLFSNVILTEKPAGEWKDSYWNVAQGKPDYETLLDQVANLSLVDPEKLSVPERIAFFLNVFHVMVVHIHIEYGSPSSGLRRRTFFRTYQYRIGPHLYTLDQIRYGILMSNVKTRISKKDPRRKICLESFDPRYYFCLSLLTESSAPVRLYSADNIASEIENATQKYLSNVDINVTKRKVILPWIFDNRRKDFIKGDSSGGQTEDVGLNIMNVLDSFGPGEGKPMKAKNREQGILIWILPHLSAMNQKALRQLIQSKGGYEVKYSKRNWSTKPRFARSILGLDGPSVTSINQAGARFCLNRQKKWVGEVRLCWIVAADLLQQLFNIYRQLIDAKNKELNDAPPPDIKSQGMGNPFSIGRRQKANSLFQRIEWKDGPSLEKEWNNFTTAIHELQEIDIDGLSREQALSFWLNIYHVMLIHIVASFGKKGVARYSYKIGAATFSLEDISEGILRANPKIDSFLTRRHYFEKTDLRKSYALVAPDPRINFALSDLMIGSPSIQVYTPEIVEELLKQAGYTFLDHNVVIEAPKKKIKFPKILDRRRHEFGAKRDRELVEAVLQFMAPHIRAAYEKTLEQKKNIKLKFFDVKTGLLYPDVGLTLSQSVINLEQIGKNSQKKIQLGAGISSSVDAVPPSQSSTSETSESPSSETN